MNKRIFWSALAVSLTLLGAAGAADAQVVSATLGEFGGATVEDFEGIGAGLPASAVFVAGVRIPPPGFVFPSGMTLTLPNPNAPEDSDFLIGEFALGNAFYGLADNGAIDEPEDLRSGTAYAGSGVVDPNVVRFEFGTPIDRFGAFFSTLSSGGNPDDLTIRLLDAGNVVIGSVTFDSSSPAPLTDANFLGVRSLSTPVAAVELDAAGFYAFDDVLFRAAGGGGAAPEPGALALLAVGGIALVARRRR